MKHKELKLDDFTGPSHSEEKKSKKIGRKKTIGTPQSATWIEECGDKRRRSTLCIKAFEVFEVFVAAMSGSRMLKQRAEKFDANINKRGNVKLCMALT